ncbi:hypothetical protein Hanom_Chr10g00937221 [Helianthus anomalus]
MNAPVSFFTFRFWPPYFLLSQVHTSTFSLIFSLLSHTSGRRRRDSGAGILGQATRTHPQHSFPSYDTPTPFVFSLSHTIFDWRAAEPTVLRQRRTSDGGFDGGSVASTLQIYPSDLLPVPAFRLDQWGCILFYADGRGSQEPHSGGD